MVFEIGPPVSGRACGLPQSTFVTKTFPPVGLGSALGVGSATFGWRRVFQHALVLVAVPPSLRLVLHIRTGFLSSGPGVRRGFNSLLLCITSGCGHPLGQ